MAPLENFDTVIGLEVHCQLSTKTKIFCSCPTSFGADPNEHLCPICGGFPGVLPVLNQQVIDMAILTGLALSCEVQQKSRFDRKNYFYPDLPKAYQITQLFEPICIGGRLEVNTDEIKKTVGITRIHIEEDAGKLLHSGSDLAQATSSLVDLNRAGTPLLEIVSEPDLTSAAEAKAYLQELRRILIYLGVNDGNLEEGSLRCDANVSLKPKGSATFGTRVEIKNLNSFTALLKAIEYERERQAELLTSGQRIIQETRLWNDDLSKTLSMRSKEEAMDYRYFPEPDLLECTIEKSYINNIAAKLPELPPAKLNRYKLEFNLSDYDANQLIDNMDRMRLFEATVALGADPKPTNNWLNGEIAAYLNDNKIELDNTKLTAKKLNELISLIKGGKINQAVAKSLLPKLMEGDKMPAELVKEAGLEQIDDTEALTKVVLEVIEANPKVYEDYKSGKKASSQFFVGQVMRQTKGRAKPDTVTQLIIETLDKLIESGK